MDQWVRWLQIVTDSKNMWNRTEIIYPRPNRQLLLFLKEAHFYPDYMDLPKTHIVMGCFFINEYFGREKGFNSDEKYYFESLDLHIHLSVDEVLAWMYVPVKELNCTKESYD